MYTSSSTSSADRFRIEPAAGVSRRWRTPGIVNGSSSIAHHACAKIHQIAKIQVGPPAIRVQDDIVGLSITLWAKLDVLIEARKCQIPCVEGQVGPWEPLASSPGVVHGFGKKVNAIVDCPKKGRNLKFGSMKNTTKRKSSNNCCTCNQIAIFF